VWPDKRSFWRAWNAGCRHGREDRHESAVHRVGALRFAVVLAHRAEDPNLT
jgi:hypothetical protein